MDNEEVKFNIFRSMKHPEMVNNCFRIDVVDKCVEESLEAELVEDVAARAIMLDAGSVDDDATSEIVQTLDATPKWTPPLYPRGLELELGKSKLQPSVITRA